MGGGALSPGGKCTGLTERYIDLLGEKGRLHLDVTHRVSEVGVALLCVLQGALCFMEKVCGDEFKGFA